MTNESMDLEQVATYLRRDAREVSKLASRGHLPGRKVSGEWRFSRAEVTHWVETQMHAYTEDQLADLDGHHVHQDPELIVGSLLPEACVAVPLLARTKASVIAELVKLAEQSGQVYDSQAILSALNAREELGSTGLESGVAIPHPRRPLPYAVGEPIIAFGRTDSGIPFGAPHGALTDLFFLVCCQDDRSHLRTLARLSRILLRPGVMDELRRVNDSREAFALLLQTEREVVL